MTTLDATHNGRIHPTADQLQRPGQAASLLYRVLLKHALMLVVSILPAYEFSCALLRCWRRKVWCGGLHFNLWAVACLGGHQELPEPPPEDVGDADGARRGLEDLYNLF